MASALQQHGVQRVIAVGDQISKYLPQFLGSGIALEIYNGTEQFFQQYRSSSFFNETILVKGARRFRFERIVSMLETKIHQTRLEIDLNALAHNLKQYQKLLYPHTKVMVMVKAFSYGSGSAEIANVLQFNHVHYLGVAYADEGIALRRSGIRLPIMVMNAEASSFHAIIEHQLQPVLFSMEVLHQFEEVVRQSGLQQYPIHLEIETGMHRLGLNIDEIEAVSRYLGKSEWLHIQSVFSHLVASEDETQDGFTVEQNAVFGKAVALFQTHIHYAFLQHIANSAAIVRHPQLQKDMVRLGIGIYGIEIKTEQLDLQPVASLKATIAQLKYLEPGDTVSYNRRGIVKERSVIATIRIGYADGYSRRLGNGVGKMYVNGHLAPVVGTVCMDMTMIDVTGIPGVKEGGEVVVFGKELPVQQLADWMGTIPYEVMTSVSHRVTRVYFQE
jgi:alanine racemase